MINSINMIKNRTYLILTITVFLSLLIPTLVQDGMFLDGVTYSAISKNMANGYGSYWNPHYTKILYPNFHEHPPMVFIIQSFFFKFFGDTFCTERIFSLFITLLTAIGIIQCWRIITDKFDLKEYYWLPVLLWLLIPLVSWSYKNNLLENTMGVFTIFAILFILKALIESRILFIFIAAILIILAFLSKGFVGIFPVATPLLFAVIYDSKKRAVLYFLFLIILIATFSLFLLIVFPEIKDNITIYFDQQLFPALHNQREITTNNRFNLIFDLILILSIPIVILLYILFKQWQKNRNLMILKNKQFLLFLLIAISASLPLIISFKQRQFYLIPSIPFYTLSFSYLIVSYLKESLDRVPKSSLKLLNSVTLGILSIVLIFSTFRFGEFSRDKEKLKDIYTISNYIPEGAIISITKELYSDWSLVAYMSRVGYLSLDCDNKHEYFLMEKNSKTIPPIEYSQIDLKLNLYIILKRKLQQSNLDKK